MKGAVNNFSLRRAFSTNPEKMVTAVTTTSFEITASESAEQTFEAAEIFPWKQKINELQKPSA